MSYENNEYYKSTSPYYLTIADNIKMDKDNSIFSKVLNSATNYRYSFLYWFI